MQKMLHFRRNPPCTNIHVYECFTDNNAGKQYSEAMSYPDFNLREGIKNSKNDTSKRERQKGGTIASLSLQRKLDQKSTQLIKNLDQSCLICEGNTAPSDNSWPECKCVRNCLTLPPPPGPSSLSVHMHNLYMGINAAMNAESPTFKKDL